jgi:hypothetical protein
MKKSLVGSIVFPILLLSCSNPKIIQSNRTNTSLDSNGPCLRMPFSSGIVVLCSQGNFSPYGFSHNFDRINCFFSLDFLNTTIKDLEVVAAAEGEIVDTFSSAIPDANFHDGGWGWGNYVVIHHGNNFYTLYAHLSKIETGIGQKVKSGDILGTVGMTGLAGEIAHLHFGLFSGHFTKHDGNNPPKLPEQFPIERLLTIDLDRKDKTFKYYKGFEIVGIPVLFGNIYGSENSSIHKPRIGYLSKSALDSLNASRQNLINYLKTDPFKIVKINVNSNNQKQIELFKEKLKNIK